MTSAWQNLEGRREYLRQHSENSTRLATAHARFQTTGWGEVEFENCFIFGVTFVDQPSVSFGYSLQEGLDPVPSRFPRAFGFVSQWKLNDKGFYVGAWCAVAVDDRSSFIGTTEPDPDYVLEHDFRFEGIAMKDVPAHLGEGA